MLANDPLLLTGETVALSHVPLSVMALVTLNTHMLAGALSLVIMSVERRVVVVDEAQARIKAAMPLPLPSVSLILSEVIDAKVVLSNFSLPDPGSELAVSVR